MDTPFPLLCKPQVGWIVIFNNFAAFYILHKRIYFCNIFHQKKFFFLGEIIFRGHFRAKKGLSAWF